MIYLPHATEVVHAETNAGNDLRQAAAGWSQASAGNFRFSLPGLYEIRRQIALILTDELRFPSEARVPCV
jgi:hypothetical protein